MNSRFSIHAFFTSLFVLSLTSALHACNSPVSVTDTASSLGQTTTASSSGSRFANGTKAVKVITSKTALTGSFSLPGVLPAVTPIPTVYPGYDGSTTYNPGVSAYQYFDVDGTTVISKPSWLVDVQLGITSLTASSACATFGGSSNNLDVQDFYRTSERNCTVTQDGTGASSDKVFARIVLNRDTTYLGYGENLLVQIEYQASGIHLNSDGTNADVENNLDQLWKVFWNSTLGASSPPKPFSVFVPPNYSACIPSGSGNTGFNTAADMCYPTSNPSYRGAPIRVKQILIPLSAYPTASVIQLSRVKSRITNADGYNYVADFCDADTPLCLGLVIRSITLMRM